MTVFYKSQKVADLLGVSLPEIRNLSDTGKLTTKLEDGEMLVTADSLVDLADEGAFSFLKNRFPAFAKARGLGTGSLFSIGAVANLLGLNSTGVLDMINVGSLGTAVSDGEQMVSGDSLRNLIIGDQHKYGSLISSLGDFALSQIGLSKVIGFGIPSVADHLGLGISSLRSLIDRGTVNTILDGENEYVEAESLSQYVQNEPAYANSKYEFGDFIFSQLGFDVAPDASIPSYETDISAISADLPDAPDVDVDDGGIGLSKGAIGAGIAGAVGATAAGLAGKLPDVNLPDVPDVNVPDVNVPDVNLPQVDFPNVDLPDVPDVSVPDVNMPSMPDVNVPDVNMPSIPDVNVPDVDVPGIRDVNVPDVDVPGIRDVNVPDMDVPSIRDVNVPDVDVPSIRDVNVPDVDMPRTPDVNVPDVDVPGIRDVNVPDVNMPRTPDVGVPDVDVPRVGRRGVDLPSADAGGIRPPGIGRPDLAVGNRTPGWIYFALIGALSLFAFMTLISVANRMSDDTVDTAPVGAPEVFNPIGDAPSGSEVGAVGDDGTKTLIPTVTPSPAPTDAPDPTNTPRSREVNSFAGAIEENDTFTTLAGALSTTGLDSALEEGGPYTVFAPVNRAFSGTPDGLLESLSDDELSELLTYHVIEGEVMAEDVVELDSATTLFGEDVSIKVEDGTVFINDARVIATDIETENGIMHVIDKVLIPESMIPAPEETDQPTEEPTSAPPAFENIVDFISSSDGLTVLEGALDDTGLLSTLEGDGPFTVFAPLNAAFTRLPEGTIESLSEDELANVLLYHVVEGKVMAVDVVDLDTATTIQGDTLNITVENGTVFVNDARVIATDLEAENGVIHLLDNVLIPPSAPPPPEATPIPTEGTGEKITGFVQGLDSLSIVAGALDATDLTSALEGDGPFTLFAPINGAFAGLPDGTLDSLSEDQLREVLLYHVVEGEVTSDVVSGLSSGTTLQGEDFEVTTDGDSVFINGARVIVADVQMENGVVHVIDGVLIPPSIVDGDTGSGDGDGTGDAGDGDGDSDGDSGSAREAAANVHIIMDASWSMTLPPDTNDESQRLDVDDPGNRIALAREALVNLVTNDIPEGTPIGLRAFGNLEGDYSCRTDLMAVPGQLDNGSMAELIEEIEPQFNANTPLAEAIAAVPSDIADLDGRTVVILITDGAETCFGEPGTAAVGLGASRNNIELNIVGLSIEDDGTRGNLARIAEIGEGSYYDVTDIDQFGNALRAALE